MATKPLKAMATALRKVWPLLVLGALHGARAGAKRSMSSAQSLAAAREDALSFAEAGAVCWAKVWVLLGSHWKFVKAI